MPRAESVPQEIVTALRGVAAALERANEESQRRWATFQVATAGHFEVLPQRARCEGYHLFRLAAREHSGVQAPASLAAGTGTWFSPRHGAVPAEPPGARAGRGP